ncbi:hypothetical protein D3C86_1848640 [compost metagenome]
MQAFGEPAKVLILTITETEHGVVQAVERRSLTQYLALETASIVRCIAVAEGADHEQRITGVTQILFADICQWLHLHR